MGTLITREIWISPRVAEFTDNEFGLLVVLCKLYSFTVFSYSAMTRNPNESNNEVACYY